MKHLRNVLLLVMALAGMAAKAATPVQWTAKVEMTGVSEGVVVLSASIEDGWHVYGLQMPADGPSSTKIYYTPSGIAFDGNATVAPSPKKVKDDLFGVELTYWEGKVTFRRKFRLVDAANASVRVRVEFMACNDSNCLPPTSKEFDLKIAR